MPTALDPPQCLFEISSQPIDGALLRARLADPRAGACANFEGWVRNHNERKPVTGLRYDAYPALAVSEGTRIVQDASMRFELLGAGCIHRIGSLEIGDLAIWVGVSAAHRDAAFAACRYIVDEVKARVPIWKYERYADGMANWLHPLDEFAIDIDKQGDGLAG